MAAAAQLSNWNVRNPNREIRYYPDQRWVTPQIVPRGANFNQYIVPDIEVYLNSTYKWLVQNTEQVADPTNSFTCWVPPNGNGISSTNAGYKRLNWLNGKIQCHQFVWLYHSPGEMIELDISHLCANPGCCRLDHLCEESRNDNIGRRGCPGYLIHRRTGLVIRVCKHDPTCRKSQYYDRNNIVRNFVAQQ